MCPCALRAPCARVCVCVCARAHVRLYAGSRQLCWRPNVGHNCASLPAPLGAGIQMLQAELLTEGFLLMIYGYPVVQATPRAFLGRVGRRHGPRPRTDRAGAVTGWPPAAEGDASPFLLLGQPWGNHQRFHWMSWGRGGPEVSPEPPGEDLEAASWAGHMHLPQTQWKAPTQGCFPPSVLLGLASHSRASPGAVLCCELLWLLGAVFSPYLRPRQGSPPLLGADRIPGAIPGGWM